MKSAIDMTPAQLRDAAHMAILRELGAMGLIRYLREQGYGSGDYTRDRHLILPDYQTNEELMKDIEAWREGSRKENLPD